MAGLDSPFWKRLHCRIWDFLRRTVAPNVAKVPEDCDFTDSKLGIIDSRSSFTEVWPDTLVHPGFAPNFLCEMLFLLLIHSLSLPLITLFSAHDPIGLVPGGRELSLSCNVGAVS